MKRIFALFLFSCLVASCHEGSKVSYSTNMEFGPETALENPFIHSVYFWFKGEVTFEQLEVFYQDTEKLREIEVVKAMYTGKAAATDRPIVERSYDFAVIVHFEDLAAHDAYQKDPIHLALLEKHASLWERIMITDVE